MARRGSFDGTDPLGGRDALSIGPGSGGPEALAVEYGTDALAVGFGTDALAGGFAGNDALTVGSDADALRPDPVGDALAAVPAIGDALAAGDAAGSDPLAGYPDATVIGDPGRRVRPPRPGAVPPGPVPPGPVPPGPVPPGPVPPGPAGDAPTGAAGRGGPRPRTGAARPSGTRSRTAGPGDRRSTGAQPGAARPGGERPPYGSGSSRRSGPTWEDLNRMAGQPPRAPGQPPRAPGQPPRAPGQPRTPRYGDQPPRGPRYSDEAPASVEWYGGPPHDTNRAPWQDRDDTGASPAGRTSPPPGRPNRITRPTGTVPWQGQPRSGWDSFLTGGAPGTGSGRTPPPSGAEIVRALIEAFRRSLGGGTGGR